jgi:hypothetical protein
MENILMKNIKNEYNNKIMYIEAQVNEINAHLRELDAFEASVMRKNLPDEYKAELHHTLNSARAEANEAKWKAIGVANKLKENAKRYLIDHNYGRH